MPLNDVSILSILKDNKLDNNAQFLDKITDFFAKRFLVIKSDAKLIFKRCAILSSGFMPLFNSLQTESIDVPA
jgi:hypothetical protein